MAQFTINIPDTEVTRLDDAAQTIAHALADHFSSVGVAISRVLPERSEDWYETTIDEEVTSLVNDLPWAWCDQCQSYHHPFNTTCALLAGAIAKVKLLKAAGWKKADFARALKDELSS